MPALAGHGAEAHPAGAVADEPMTLQCFGERLLEIVQRPLVTLVRGGVLGGGIEAGSSPGLLVGFDEEGAAVRRIGVGVYDEGSVRRGHWGEQRGGQREVGAAPQ